jgi:hypothetical protein
MKAPACASALVAIALGLSVWAGGQRAEAARPLEPVNSTPTSSSTRLFLGGRIRCTATVNADVEVGHAVSVGFTVHNVSKRPAPPAGSAPPMSAQCSVSISSEGGFWVAQVLVLVPPGLPGVRVFQPYETLWPASRFVPLASGPPYAAIAWEFVLTRDGAMPVAASPLVASKDSPQTAPFFDWDGMSWRLDGTGTCGGTGFASGALGLRSSSSRSAPPD